MYGVGAVAVEVLRAYALCPFSWTHDALQHRKSKASLLIVVFSAKQTSEFLLSFYPADLPVTMCRTYILVREPLGIELQVCRTYWCDASFFTAIHVIHFLSFHLLVVNCLSCLITHLFKASICLGMSVSWLSNSSRSSSFSP